MTDDRKLLEQILTAHVLILSKLLDAEAQKKGIRRGGGDFTREAVQLIEKEGPAIATLFR